METLNMSKSVFIDRTIEMNQIENTEFYEYVDTQKITTDGKVDIKVKHGVSTEDIIKSVKGDDPIPIKVPAENMYESWAYVVQISEDNLKRVQAGECHITDNVLVYLTDGLIPKYRIILFNPGSNQIADLNHKYIPLPYSINYCNGHITSSKYNLKSILDSMKNHPNVVDKKNISIEEIPFYQDEEGKFISFKYLPTQEEYDKLQTVSCLSRTDMIINDFLQLDRFLINETNT